MNSTTALVGTFADSIWTKVGLRNCFYAVPIKELGDAALKLPAVPTRADMETPGAIPDYTSQAIPAFFLLIFVEWIVGVLRGRKIVRINDSIMSISCGLVMSLFGVLAKALTHGMYIELYRRYGMTSLFAVDSLQTFVFAFLAQDFMYYWFHRSAHVYHFAWSAHSVHHSGEDYNLATALRQGTLQQVFSAFFYLILGLFMHPAVFAMHSMLNTLGQFWIHTTVVGRLGPLEYIFNTPTHHRSHHQPPGNCNYAGILIIWDRMFGTFVAEKRQRERYGLAKQYTSFDPIWANFEHLNRVYSVNGPNKGWLNYLMRPFRRRTNHPWVFRPLAIFEKIPDAEVSSWVIPDKPERQKLDGEDVHMALTVYTAVQFLINLVVGVVLLRVGRRLNIGQFVVCYAIICFSLSCIGRLSNKLSDGSVRETFRVVALLAGGYWAQGVMFGGNVLSRLTPQVSAADLGALSSLTPDLWNGVLVFLMMQCVMWALTLFIAHSLGSQGVVTKQKRT